MRKDEDMSKQAELEYTKKLTDVKEEFQSGKLSKADFLTHSLDILKEISNEKRLSHAKRFYAKKQITILNQVKKMMNHVKKNTK